MSFPRYPKYKDSGADWLGQVPEQWNTRKIRWLFEIQKRIAGELGFDVFSITQKGIKVKDLESNDGQIAMDYSKYQLVEIGDFAMNHMDLLTGGVDIASARGVTSPDYRVVTIRDHSTCCDRYLLYVFQTCYRNKIFYAYGQGSSQLGRWRFPTEQFKDFYFPLPQKSEQQNIAEFLDRETAKINALVAEQQRLMELLKEKRQAVIGHAVTKGLRNSDIPLLRLKFLLDKIETGFTPDSHGFPAQAGQSGVLKSGCVNGGIFDPNENKLLSEKVDPPANLEVKFGDILMSRASGSSDLIGSVAFVQETPLPKLYLSDKTFRVRQKSSRLDANFFVWAMNSNFLRNQISQIISGAEGLAKNIPQSEIRELQMPIPTIEEQRKIVSFIEKEAQKFDALTAEAQRAIDLLQERRAALISAAVTGQIDVRQLKKEAA